MVLKCDRVPVRRCNGLIALGCSACARAATANKNDLDEDHDCESQQRDKRNGDYLRGDAQNETPLPVGSSRAFGECAGCEEEWPHELKRRADTGAQREFRGRDQEQRDACKAGPPDHEQ